MLHGMKLSCQFAIMWGGSSVLGAVVVRILLWILNIVEFRYQGLGYMMDN